MFTISHPLCFPSSLYAPPATRIRHRLIPRRWLNFCSNSSRFRNYNSRCSITNTELQLSNIVAVDEIQQDLPATDSDCPPPIVHIKPDILDTEPLSLLAEAAFVDALLTALPIISKEEQEALAATPAHPTALYALYASCLTGNLVEQLWNFAWPSTIAMFYPSLLPVAVMGFFAKVFLISKNDKSNTKCA